MFLFLFWHLENNLIKMMKFHFLNSTTKTKKRAFFFSFSLSLSLSLSLSFSFFLVNICLILCFLFSSRTFWKRVHTAKNAILADKGVEEDGSDVDGEDVVGEVVADVVVVLVEELLQRLVGVAVLFLGSAGDVPLEEGHSPAGEVAKGESRDGHEDHGSIQQPVGDLGGHLLPSGHRKRRGYLGAHETEADAGDDHGEHQQAHRLVQVHQVVAEFLLLLCRRRVILLDAPRHESRSHQEADSCGAEPMEPGQPFGIPLHSLRRGRGRGRCPINLACQPWSRCGQSRQHRRLV